MKIGAGTRASVKRRRGQSFVEFAIFLPIFLIMVSGLTEFGFLLNDYMNVIDGPREGARYASDVDPKIEGVGCQDMNPTFYADPNSNFYNCVAAITLSSIRPVIPNPDPSKWNVDIVVSVLAVDSTAANSALTRYPSVTGWDYNSTFHNIYTHTSKFSNSQIANMIDANPSRQPRTGMVMVEIFYAYKQHMALPWITVFVPDPIEVYSYTIMPMVSAEPAYP